MRSLLALTLVACSWFSTSDEDQVRRAISEIAAAAGEPDLGDVLGGISESYRDDDGLSKDNLRGFLFNEFRRRGPIRTVLSPIHVALSEDGQSATARFEAVVAVGVTLTDPMPEDAEVFRFEVDLKREEGDWRVTGHRRTSSSGR